MVFELVEALIAGLITRILEVILFYYLLQFVFYLYHRLLHNPISGPLYRMHHIGHHKQQFPVRHLRALAYGSGAAAVDANAQTCIRNVDLPDVAAVGARDSAKQSAEALGSFPDKKEIIKIVAAGMESSRSSSGSSVAHVKASDSILGQTVGAVSEDQRAAASREAIPAASTHPSSAMHLKDGWFETGGELAFGIPATIAAVLSVVYLPGWTAFTLITTMIYVTLTGEILHSSYHLYDDALSHPESLALHRLLVRGQWFRRYQHLHDIHHAKPGTNFGFFDFTMDRLFGTYESVAPPFLSIPPYSSKTTQFSGQKEK